MDSLLNCSNCTWKEEDKDGCQSTCEVNDVSDLRGDQRERKGEKEPYHTDRPQPTAFVGGKEIISLAQLQQLHQDAVNCCPT